MAVIIFDLDGTLIDSAPDIQAAVNLTLGEIGQPPLDLALVTSFIGDGVSVLIERVRAHCGLQGSHGALLARFRHHYDADPTSRTRLYPGVLDALDALAAGGHKLGLCTNKPARPARAIVEAVGLGGHFAALVGGDTLPERKPHPAPLLAVQAALGRGPVLFVGDSETDAATAEAAGTPFALFTLGYRKSPVEKIRHDVAFDDYTSLPDLAHELLARQGRAKTNP